MNREIRLIEWVDSSFANAWHPEEDDDSEISRCYSVGFLLRETDDSVVIMQSHEHQGCIDAVLAIPKVAIVKQRTLRKASGPTSLTSSSATRRAGPTSMPTDTGRT